MICCMTKVVLLSMVVMLRIPNRRSYRARTDEGAELHSPLDIQRNFKSMVVLVNPKKGVAAAQKYVKEVRRTYPKIPVHCVLEQTPIG